MYPYRIKFKSGIIAEFIAPRRLSKNNKVVIFCDGLPSVPAKNKILEEFGKKGYYAFHIRYKGSWESAGIFLKQSPHVDIIDIINELYSPIKEALTGKKFLIKPGKIILIGSSFGGAAVLLASMHSKVNKVIAISPVTDWSKVNKTEPLNKMFKFLKDGFGSAYRIYKPNWDKLGKSNFYNPISYVNQIPGNKIMIIQAKNDKVVRFGPVKSFAQKTKSAIYLVSTGGHMGSSVLMNSVKIKQKVLKFIKSK